MKNTYLTSYFPLISIFIFSLSLSMRAEIILLDLLKDTGIYEGMLEFFSEAGIKLSILILLIVLFFMVFAALKLLADTINELSLLFFSKDNKGESLTRVRNGSTIFFVGSALSLLSMYSFMGISIIFFVSIMVYFIYFVYKVSISVTTAGLIGMVFFQVIIWSTLVSSVFYIALKVYNSIIASLPV